MSPKDQESLEESREIRAYLISKYGFIPESIIPADWSIKTDRRRQKTYLEHRKAGKNWGTAFSLSDLSSGQLHSDFPHNVCRFFIKFLTEDKLEEPGCYGNYLPTVLDPFAGHNSRMEDCFATFRNYVGHDLCKEFMETNREIREKLLTGTLWPQDSLPRLALVEGDSRDTINYVEKFDMAITSPPFWDIEQYGPEAEQLSEQKTFNDFMFSLGKVFSNVFKALKPNTFFVVEVNDFRRQGVFYTYHSSAIQWLQRVGFTIHDIVICDYQKSIQQAFAVQLDRIKVVGKRHSYFIVCSKQRKLEDTQEHRERVAVKAHEYIEEKEPGEIKQAVMMF